LGKLHGAFSILKGPEIITETVTSLLMEFASPWPK
jgi:hypothetical protein